MNIKTTGARVFLTVLAACCVIGLSACSQQTSAQQDPAASGPDASLSGGPAASQAKDQTTVFGKVTQVSGSKITLALGTMKNAGGFSGQGAGRSGKPQGNAAGTVSRQRPSSGSFSDMLTLTGKTTTITITDTGVLKKRGARAPGRTGKPGGSGSSGLSSGTGKGSFGRNTSSASLSDIKTGSILSVTTQNSDGSLVSVVIMG